MFICVIKRREVRLNKEEGVTCMGRSMSDLLKDMEKMYGDDANIWKANEDILAKGEGISTGSHLLDMEISKVVQGIAKGRVIQIAGRPATGKSFLSMLCIKSLQESDPNAYAIWFDCEFTWDPSWAESLGVDTGRVLVIPENSGVIIEERLTGVPGDKLNSKKKKPGILDIELTEGSSGLGLIVLDSVASILPPMEETTSSHKANIAPLSRWLTPFLRKIVPLLSKTKITLIGVNQLKEDVGAFSPYGVVEKSPGGRSFHHSQSLCLHMKKMGKKEYEIIDPETKECVGGKTKIVIKKNKLAPGKDKQVEIDLDFTKGVVNYYKEAAELGIKFGIIDRPNAKMYHIGEEKFNGRENMEKYLRENPDIVDKIIKDVKEGSKEAE